MKSHNGTTLATAFANVLCDFKIEHKVSHLVISVVPRAYPYTSQILSVTCDNASNNDTMTASLETTLPAFSRFNRTRCFAHILNLVAKSLLRQFDVRKKVVRDVEDVEDDNEPELTDEELEQEKALLELAQGLDEEERTTAQETDPDENIEEDDDVEGWVDEVEELSASERNELLRKVRPVKLVLAKVSTESHREYLTMFTAIC